MNKTSPFYYSLTGLKGPNHALSYSMFPFPINREKIEIGLTGFTDWKGVNSSSSYCYEFITNEDGLDTSEDFVPRNILPDNYTDGWDSTLNALYFTAIDKNIRWNSDTNVIVVISNNRWKYAEDDNPARGPEYKFPSPDGKPNDAPCELGPVSKRLLFDTLEKRNILLLGLLTPTIYSTYKNFFTTANTPNNYRVLKIDGIDATTAEGITGLIMPIVRERVCTCDMVRYEFALIIDSTHTVKNLRYPEIVRF